MLKRYLPAYQTPELMEELKEHDRMRLIREREEGARRRTARSAPRDTTDSPPSPFSTKSRERDAWVSVAPTRLTDGNSFGRSVRSLPYQETQTFKDVLREFRDKVTTEEASGRRPPVSRLSRRTAYERKGSKQLFPSESGSRGEVATTSDFDEVVNRLQPVYE
ncbi:uncharacterized protein LOC109504653 [Harpegnathos saltator]|uniref:uncharacterized protein LOC109504653 n=1 Tax=Harpegnathos saltator TaxID=610380 RepID=UPI000DBED4E7|nr:uncharacterized protein LOC109504653 [Harpegnathos saltator]